MARLRLDIDLDNAAFEEGRDAELATVFRLLAHRIEAYPGEISWAVRDSNGNRVGQAEIGVGPAAR